MFNVMCQVSGGVTGTRQSLLKENGRVKYFNDEESAAAEARRLNAQMNNAYSVAYFRYWVVESDDL